VIATRLRSSFVQALSGLPVPGGLITQEDQLQAAMYAAMGMETVPALFPSLPGDYSVIALPEQRATPDASITTMALRLTQISLVRQRPTGVSSGATLVPGGVRVIFGPTKERWEETVIKIGSIETITPFELFIPM